DREVSTASIWSDPASIRRAASSTATLVVAAASGRRAATALARSATSVATSRVAVAKSRSWPSSADVARLGLLFTAIGRSSCDGRSTAPTVRAAQRRALVRRSQLDCSDVTSPDRTRTPRPLQAGCHSGIESPTRYETRPRYLRDAGDVARGQLGGPFDGIRTSQDRRQEDDARGRQ